MHSLFGLGTPTMAFSTVGIEKVVDSAGGFASHGHKGTLFDGPTAMFGISADSKIQIVHAKQLETLATVFGKKRKTPGVESVKREEEGKEEKENGTD
jgi:hypothetical protein